MGEPWYYLDTDRVIQLGIVRHAVVSFLTSVLPGLCILFLPFSCGPVGALLKGFAYFSSIPENLDFGLCLVYTPSLVEVIYCK